MSEKIIVPIDPDLEDLIPGFLSNRNRDVNAIEEHLANGDFDAIRMLGHSMKGAGAGYGFDPITDYGARLERAAEEQARDEIVAARADLADYLSRVEPTFD